MEGILWPHKIQDMEFYGGIFGPVKSKCGVFVEEHFGLIKSNMEFCGEIFWPHKIQGMEFYGGMFGPVKSKYGVLWRNILAS